MTAPNAAIAVGFGDKPPLQRMRLVKWRRVVRGSLRGFATVELPIGLVIYDAPVFVGRNGPFARMPAKPQLDRDGRQKRADGQPLYDAVIDWKSRALADRFSAALIALVVAAHPDALAGEAVAA